MSVKIFIMLALGLATAACTGTGKLQRYIEDNNTKLAGKQIGPGMWCDGMSLEGDTVVITYRQPQVVATPQELADWDAISDSYHDLLLQGLGNDKTSDPEGAGLLVESGVYMKGIFKFANAEINVVATPAEIAEVLK